MKKGIKLSALLTIALCLLCVGMFVACKKNTPPVTPSAPSTLTMSQTAASLDLHEQVQLSVEETGETTWESSSTAVCTVDGNGLVKSVGAGTATVTASQGDAKGTCAVTVTNSRTAPLITVTADGGNVSRLTLDKDVNKLLTAAVSYKGKPVAATDFAAFDWSVTGDNGITLTPSDDKTSATLNCGAYGEATVTVTTTVWGTENIVAQIPVTVFNSKVVFSVTGLEQNSAGAYTVALNTVTATGEECALTPSLTCTDDGTPTDDITWSSSLNTVATVSNGVITAKSIGTTTVKASHNGNYVLFDVTVNKAEIDLTATQHVDVSLWDMNSNKANLRTSYPSTQEIESMRAKTVAVALPTVVKGTVQAINVTYTYEDNSGSTAETRTAIFNIFKGYNATESQKVDVQPSYYSYNMGEKVATVVTDKADYTLPMAFYTMKISNADELDAFRYYTTYQYGLTETQMQGEYAPTLYDGFFVLDANVTYNDYAQTQLAAVKNFAEQNAHLWNDDIYDTLVGNGFRKYKSFITDNDKAKFNNIAANAYGFIGTFDGCGYNIAGLFIDRASQNANECGGFIGHLTKNVSQGTIQNTSFTDVIYGNFYLSKNNSTLGTVGGFLYTYNLQAVVRNIYIKASCIYGNVPLMGSVANNWSAQISSDDAIWENVLCEVVNTDDSNANNYVLGRFSVYDHKPIVRNLYAVVYKNMKTDKPFQGVSLENGNSQNINVRKEAFATLTGDNSLATHLNGDYTGWDTEYWDTSSGAPVFKTK